MHPVPRRCSSVTYVEYAPSSRLAGRVKSSVRGWPRPSRSTSSPPFGGFGTDCPPRALRARFRRISGGRSVAKPQKRLKNLLKRADRILVKTEIRVGQTLAAAADVANRSPRCSEQIGRLSPGSVEISLNRWRAPMAS